MTERARTEMEKGKHEGSRNLNQTNYYVTKWTIGTIITRQEVNRS